MKKTIILLLFLFLLISFTAEEEILDLLLLSFSAEEESIELEEEIVFKEENLPVINNIYMSLMRTAPQNDYSVVQNKGNVISLKIEIDFTSKLEPSDVYTTSTACLPSLKGEVFSKERKQSAAATCINEANLLESRDETYRNNFRGIGIVKTEIISMCWIGNGTVTIRNELIDLGNGNYKYICEKYELNHKAFVLNNIIFSFYDQNLPIRYNLSQIATYNDVMYKLNCFQDSKGWTINYGFVHDFPYASANNDYRTAEKIDTYDSAKSCIDFTDDIIFNDTVYNDGDILWVDYYIYLSDKTPLGDDYYMDVHFDNE